MSTLFCKMFLTCKYLMCFLIFIAAPSRSLTCKVSGFLYSISSRLYTSCQWRSVKSVPRRYFSRGAKSCLDKNKCSFVDSSIQQNLSLLAKILSCVCTWSKIILYYIFFFFKTSPIISF